jgi:hypothetical protein
MNKLIFFSVFFSSVVSYGQDTHYNTMQFGTRSALMGGAVVGGVRDNTAIFYNPGSIGFIDSNSVSINANLYKLENISIENALGNAKDFKGANFSNLPLLLSGMLNSKKSRLKIGYGFVSPVDFDFKANARIDESVPIVDDVESPGLENFIGQAMINTSVSELMGGLGFGYRLNENWSIGITNQVIWREHKYTEVQLSRFYLNKTGSPLVSSNIWKTMKYFQLRYVPKLGVDYSAASWDAGITITAPGINLYGRGSVAADVTANDILVNGQRIDVLANDSQEKLKAKFKSPLRIGGGFNFKSAKGTLGISGEWIAGIDFYDVLQAEPATFIRPPDLAPDIQSDDLLRVKEGGKPVLNLVVGYEYIMKPEFSLVASIRTDNTWFDPAIRDLKGIKPQISTWDIYHFTGGATFSKGKSIVSLGFIYSSGKDNNRAQSGNLAQPKESNFLQGRTTITKAKYSAFGLLFGFTLNIKNK